MEKIGFKTEICTSSNNEFKIKGINVKFEAIEST